MSYCSNIEYLQLFIEHPFICVCWVQFKNNYFLIYWYFNTSPNSEGISLDGWRESTFFSWDSIFLNELRNCFFFAFHKPIPRKFQAKEKQFNVRQKICTNIYKPWEKTRKYVLHFKARKLETSAQELVYANYHSKGYVESKSKYQKSFPIL